MINQFSRTELLLGKEGMERLHGARVAVFGVGGVGGYTVEALARTGIGELDLIDNDTFSVTNLNRQIYATIDTIGRPKVEVAKERIATINPEAVVHAHQMFYLPETADQFDFRDYDYVVDAIDTVSGKLALVEQCHKYNIPIISSMGAGNKLDPTAFRVADINKTSVCPLAKVMRRELKKRAIHKLKVVYSEEQPIKPEIPAELWEKENASGAKRQLPGSNAFVPSVVGLIIAGEVIKDIASGKAIVRKREVASE